MSSKHSIRDLLLLKSVQFSRSIVVAVVVLFIALQSVVFVSENAATRQMILTWLSKNQQRIEQAAFLGNFMAVRGVLDELGTGKGPMDAIRVNLTDSSTGSSTVIEYGANATSRCFSSNTKQDGFQVQLLEASLCFRGPLRFAERPYGSIEIAAKYNLNSLLMNTFFCSILCLLLLFAVRKSAAMMIDELKRSVIEPLSYFDRSMNSSHAQFSELADVNAESAELRSAPKEILHLIGSYNSMLAAIRELNSKERERIELLSYSQVANQVSHDIRSPLTALNMAAHNLTGIDESKKTLIRLAVKRITDISQSLLDKSRTQKRLERLESISEIVESLVMEKRAEYANRQGLQLLARTDQAYGVFVAIDASSLKRHLSNLINNAIEAIAYKGEVCIDVRADLETASVAVTDHGPGIPQAILQKLGKERVSSGKQGTASGAGIGVLHACQFASHVGGRLDISSDPTTGTEINLTLKRTSPPNWFASELRFAPRQPVVIVDDDASIHQVWKSRFARARRDDIEIVSLMSPESFLSWLGNSAKTCVNPFFLIDFEFTGNSINGLDLIDRLTQTYPASVRNTVLVTSRADEEIIQQKVIAHRGLRLLPKSLAQHIPLRLPDPLRPSEPMPPSEWNASI